MAFTALDTFVSRVLAGRAGWGWAAVSRQESRNPAVLLEAEGLCPKQPPISLDTAAQDVARQLLTPGLAPRALHAAGITWCGLARAVLQRLPSSYQADNGFGCCWPGLDST